MKKIIAFILTATIITTLFFSTVSAVEKDSIQSPTLSDGEVIVEEDDNKQHSVEIIRYSEKAVLTESEQAVFVQSYNVISAKYDNLTDLNSAVAQRAKELVLDDDELAVSDLYTVKVTPNDGTSCSVKLYTDLMEEYVILLRYENGSWSKVNDAVWSSNGKYVEFTASGTYPYAVIVEATKSEEETTPIEQETISSITTNSTPNMEVTVVYEDGEAADGDKEVYLVITSYNDRKKLYRVKERQLELCYRIITNASSVTELNEELSTVAEDKGFKVRNVGVSQLFDISSSDVLEAQTTDVESDRKVRYVVKLTSDAKDFVSLMYYKDDEWNIIEDVTVNYKNNTISFDYVESLPYAIVSNGAVSSPKTGDESNLMLWIIVSAISGSGIITFVCTNKRRKENR